MAKCIKLVIKRVGNGFEYRESVEDGDRIITNPPPIIHSPGMAFVYAPYRSKKKWKRELFSNTRAGLCREMINLCSTIEDFDKLCVSEGVK